MSVLKFVVGWLIMYILIMTAMMSISYQGLKSDHWRDPSSGGIRVFPPDHMPKPNPRGNPSESFNI